MANSFIAVQAVTADKKLDSETLTVGGQSVERERMQLAGATDVAIAVVSNVGNPDWTQYGLLVKVGGMVLNNTAHNQATFPGIEALAVRKDAAATLATADGLLAPLQMDAAGALRVTGAGGGSQFAEDAVHTSGELGTMALGVRRDADTTPVSLDGDYHSFVFDAVGNLKVTVKALVPGTGVAALGKAVDGVAGSADVGVAVLTVRDDALTTLAPVDGDYTTARVDSIGAAWVTLAHMPQVIGPDAHGTVITQPPVLTGAEAVTNLAGRTLVTTGQVSRFVTEYDGAQITRPQCGLGDIVTGNASNTDGTSTQVLAAGAAGVKHYLQWVHLTNTHATQFAYVEIKDGATVKDTIPVPPLGGAIVDYGNTPIPGTAATAWNFDPSAATTTIICAASAFKSKI